ncbi:hypothetical protein [Sediminibacillus massiliensis]|uniref:hypothetical protein n=1 Tax=Sediminibacillus massiliensis TaxID=1926277 RepID=UPI001FE6695D|nr:hypothetical protein [Sediminibacillus massiliensis]
MAYVFVHLLPDLKAHQDNVEGIISNSFWTAVEHHLYIVAMLGLALFYGLEKLAKSKKTNKDEDKVYQIHMISFSLYNALIGYLLVSEEFDGVTGMFFYFLAMGVHFVSNDHSLRDMLQEQYDRRGRWLLSISIGMGGILGVLFEIPEWFISVLFAILAGGVIVNVLKEELPEERNSKFGAFLVGMVGYTIILLLL